MRHIHQLLARSLLAIKKPQLRRLSWCSKHSFSQMSVTQFPTLTKFQGLDMIFTLSVWEQGLNVSFTNFLASS